ncbi:hypothetical protein P153DRAFT_358424 [Dothidotthia symphoricarpi CBS 119687]|uniref:Uncharacterized protein n=1 Tax=Dothidotthia symphoricarpi CBS 119687 TaxID=1392245 RepID=A0A6A6A6N5_9PLEO|nr:uncharacterized protein P153DRAFT_358424 [Dothidotthia symphoricarpi CBS 119687]KAF2127549.1 hypothetical protein P153DRAFT_358424 [Dothidotthia symphoricarpi CBS 119687]
MGAKPPKRPRRILKPHHRQKITENTHPTHISRRVKLEKGPQWGPKAAEEDTWIDNYARYLQRSEIRRAMLSAPERELEPEQEPAPEPEPHFMDMIEHEGSWLTVCLAKEPETLEDSQTSSPDISGPVSQDTPVSLHARVPTPPPGPVDATVPTTKPASDNTPRFYARWHSLQGEGRNGFYGSM